MSKIKNIICREIIDSKFYPALEIEIHLEDKSIGVTSISFNILNNNNINLIDNDKNRFLGNGLLNSINFIKNIIKPNIIGINSNNQYEIDNLLIDICDKNKKIINNNIIMPISISIAKAFSISKKINFFEYVSFLYGYNIFKYKNPNLLLNLLSNSIYYNNNIDVQNFMIKILKTNSFRDSMEISSKIFLNLNIILKNKNISNNITYNNGYFLNNFKIKDILNIIEESIFNAGYKLNNNITLAIDFNSSKFYNKYSKLYYFNNIYYNIEDFSNYICKLLLEYNISYVENILCKNDFINNKTFINKLSNKIQVVYNYDAFLNNEKTLEFLIKNNIYNSILIKLNQFRTLTEMLEIIKLIKKNKYSVIISNILNETEETFISDLSIGTLSDEIKFGSFNKMYSLCKYNRIIRIEDFLYNNKKYIF